MKTTINSEEFKALSACDSGYNTFVQAHGDSTVKLSQVLDSNGLEDIWWLLDAIEGQLSKGQVKDLHLLSCTYAESVLHIFEKAHPNDERPRKAIAVKRAWLEGKATKQELEAAWDDAWAAWDDVKDAAGDDAWAASTAAWATAWAAARAAARAASTAVWAAGAADDKGEKQKEQLRVLLLSWESK